MEFAVENFKGVENVKINASHGDLVIIAGKNGAGKSSFIDAITELFDARGVRVTPKPIRDGESKAVAEFTHEELDIRVRRTWTKDNSGTLEVHALDGAKYSKPAEVLAKLTGGLIFDPGRFLTLDEKKQREELLAKVELPFDLDALERTKAGAAERRLEAGREVKRLEGALKSIPKPEGTVEEISLADVVEEIRAAQKQQHEAESQDQQLEMAHSREAQIKAEIAELQAELAESQTATANLEFEIATRTPVPDIEALQVKLGSIEEHNSAAREAAKWDETNEELIEALATHKAAQAELDAVEQQKLDGLKSAEWPDPDLGLDEAGVTLEGIPFRQVNTARKILAAARIATSGNPDLKLVIVSNGDLLDEDSLAMVRDLAGERGFTVLMERDRDNGREIGFEIVEGRLVA